MLRSSLLGSDCTRGPPKEAVCAALHRFEVAQTKLTDLVVQLHSQTASSIWHNLRLEAHTNKSPASMACPLLERTAALKLIRFESIYPWPDWPFAALPVMNPATDASDHQNAFREGMRYALTQIEDVHKLLHISPITSIQDYIRSTYIGRSLMVNEGALAALTHVTDNMSIYTSFWMGGKFAIEGLLEGPIPTTAKMEGLLQCLACFAAEFRAVYEKVVQEHGAQPEVSKGWTGYT